MSNRPNEALDAWRAQLGAERVLDSQEATAHYGRGTEGFGRILAGALRPTEADQLPELMRIATAHRQAVYPISTGRNWGYGSAGPVLDGCILLDLGDLNRIRDFDPLRGLVTVEPGVTQEQLRRYLDQSGHRYMVPVTGAGPSVSLLGNALERGYGITPFCDHFGAVTAIEAVLADGSLYRPALSEWGGHKVNQGFKWGVGPYLDGLFTQSGFGIVTAVTIALAPEPEALEAIFFSFPRESDLSLAVDLVRQIFRRFRGTVGAINLLNRRRVLSMLEPYPGAEVPDGQIIPETRIETMARRHRVSPWTGIAALYGDPAVVKAASRAIKRLLKPHCCRLVALNPRRIRLLDGIARHIPGRLGADLRAQLTTLAATTDIMLGRPREVALPLAYWRSRPAPTGDLDPARDRCGLLWFPPLLPLVADEIEGYVERVNRIMPEHGLEPLITLTCFSEQSADSTIPILFDPSHPAQQARAQACYQALFEACREQGWLPYRLNIEHQRQLAEDGRLWRICGRLKRALDPHNLIAPGRYAPSHLADDVIGTDTDQC